MMRPNKPSPLLGYLAAFSSAGVASILSGIVFGRSSLSDVAMVYLLGIVVVSLRFGFRAAVLSAVLSVLGFDVFFVPPYYTFTVSDFRHIVTFGVMLLVAVVIAGLTQRVTNQMELARRGEQRTALLYALARDLSRTDDLPELLRAAAQHVEHALQAKVVVFMGPPANPRLAYATQGARHLVPVARRALEAPSRHGPAGEHHLPLASGRSSAEPLGWLSIFPETPNDSRNTERRRLAEAFSAQIAVAVERAELARETERTRLQFETEKLRSTLLSSISHDLRTPLAVMKGAASTLVDDAGALTAEARLDLSETVLEEIERLEGLVGNVLHMTRLESGSLNLVKDLQSVEELVGGALRRTERILEGRPLELHVPGDLFVACDASLIEQVLVNLLENAARYTTAGTAIRVRALEEDHVILQVSDRGPGLRPNEEQNVFEKFYRGSKRGGGVGLGLAVCRAIADAHGGSIRARNRSGGGAEFELRLPSTDTHVAELLGEAQRLAGAAP